MFTQSGRVLLSQVEARLEYRLVDPIEIRNWVARKWESPSPVLPSLPDPNQPRFCFDIIISTTSATNMKRTRSSAEPLPGMREIGGPQYALHIGPEVMRTSMGSVNGTPIPPNHPFMML